MPTFKPFCAIRPHREYAEEILCPPYDVVSKSEAAAFSALSKNSFMHIIRPDGDLPEEAEDSEQLYSYSAEMLQDFLKRKILYREQQPCFYLYEQTAGTRAQTAFIGCASVADYENGKIRRHEVTRSDKELDRIRHFSSCNANTESVFLFYPHQEELDQLIARCKQNAAPDYDTTDSADVRHRLWTIADAKDITQITAAFQRMPAMYIADGHHRTASAVKVGKQKSASESHSDNTAPYHYFLAAAFPDRDLQILGYHRLVRDLNGYTEEQLLIKLHEIGSIKKYGTEHPILKQKHTCAVYLGKQWYTLTFSESVINETDPVRSLDVSLLQDAVLAPLLGIGNPRTDERIFFLGGTSGVSELEHQVDAGKAAIAFEMFPVSIREITRIADAGQIMPPKSTWFEPKISSGWFLHSL